MKALLITEKGMERTAQKEIKEQIGAQGKLEERAVVFTAKNLEDLFKLCYLSQSAYKILTLLSTFRLKGELEADLVVIKKKLKSSSYNELLPDEFAFKVRCKRIGDQDYKSLDIEGEVGAILLENIKKKCKVSISEPDITFLLFINGKKAYFGLDLSGKDLSKRAYKIFNHPQALKGPVGFHLVKHAGVKAGDVVVDPFCGSGVIPIECALYLKRFPVRFYDKTFPFKFDYAKEDKKVRKGKLKVYCFDKEFHYVNAAKKNAKIAGVDKDINFSRSDVEWLDTKLDKGSVDKIITNPPQPSKHVDLKQLQKVYDEFFYQAEFVLKKNGMIVMLCEDKKLLEEAAKKKKFKLVSESELWQGSQRKKVLEFGKV